MSATKEIGFITQNVKYDAMYDTHLLFQVIICCVNSTV